MGLGVLLGSGLLHEVLAGDAVIYSHRYEEGMPWLMCELEIAGGGKALFMVDTGASVTVFDSDFARSIGLNTKVGDGLVNADSSKPSSIEYFEAPQMRLGKMAFTGNVGVLDLRQLKRTTGFDIKGVLGLDALIDKILEVDMDAGVMRIYRHPEPLADFPESIYVRPIPGGLRVLDVKLADVSVAFILDTGYTSVIRLKASKFEKLVANRWIQPSKFPTHFYEISGPFTAPSGAFIRGSVLDVPLDSKVVGGTEEDMLGLNFLNHFHFAIDFPNSRFHYKNRPHYLGRIYPEMHIGATFYWKDNRVTLAGVEEHRQTATSGLHLQVGDEVLQLGEFKATQLNYEVVYRLCKEFAGKKVRFKVARDQKVIFDDEILLPALEGSRE